MAQVDAQLGAGGCHLGTVGIVTVGGEQPHIRAQQAQVVGNVPAHAPKAHGDPAGVGVRPDQGREGPAADVHVDAPHHHGVAAGAQDIAPSGDKALPGQIGDMDRGAGTGDPQGIRDLLLGDEGILFDELQYLPFPLCHGWTS